MAAGRKVVSLSLEPSTEKDLRTFAKLTGKSVSKVLQEALDAVLTPYRNDNGVIDPLPGSFRDTPSAFLKDGEESTVKPCYFLRETIVFGQKYYVIYCNGTLMKVPAESVTPIKE